MLCMRDGLKRDEGLGTRDEQENPFRDCLSVEKKVLQFCSYAVLQFMVEFLELFVFGRSIKMKIQIRIFSVLFLYVIDNEAISSA
jgi:hypothetical protein